MGLVTSRLKFDISYIINYLNDTLRLKNFVYIHKCSCGFFLKVGDKVVYHFGKKKHEENYGEIRFLIRECTLFFKDFI